MVYGLLSCSLLAFPVASAERNLTVARSSLGDRLVEVVVEGDGDQGIDIRQDDGLLRVDAGGHRLTVAADGVIRVDGVARPAMGPGAITIIVREGGVELRPGIPAR